jgi:hypothetical protein
MKIHPVIYIIVGAVALGGALFAAYINITLSEMVTYMGSSDISAISGTDTASIQATANALGMIVTLLWVWIVSVIAAAALNIYTGVTAIRKK